MLDSLDTGEIDGRVSSIRDGYYFARNIDFLCVFGAFVSIWLTRVVGLCEKRLRFFYVFVNFFYN